MPTLEFRIDDIVTMAPGSGPDDTLNAIPKLVRETLGDSYLYLTWGGPTRKMEVFLSVTDDLVEECREKLQKALTSHTRTPPGYSPPTVLVKDRPSV